MAAYDPAKRQELRQRTKKHGEIAGGIAKGWVHECIQKHDEMANLDAKVSEVVWKLVHDTTKQLAGTKKLEDDLKRAVAPAHN